MKVGVLQFFGWLDRSIPLEHVYRDALQRIEVMDRTGYDAVWLAEHHFNSFSVCPSVHVVAAHAAARTTRLRIGTAVSLAALYHPLRLAEEVALVDVLSEGRVNWGAGRGFDSREFEVFGVPPAESADRFREAVEVVLRAWTEERLDYEGRFHRFAGIEVLPKPRQQPHPPVWMAATSPGSIAWAASQGHSILMDPHSSHTEIAVKRTLYAEEMARHGHAVEGRDIPVARLVAVAPTRSEAEEVARRGARWTLSSYYGPELRAQHAVRTPDAAPPPSDPVERYLDSVMVWGTPAEVTDELLRLGDEIGLDYLLCAPLSRQSFTLFTESVLPRLTR
jgi:alkanesulfonate monooxygenase SsuD/methylene tetrahydromethanopterin reductase-like flavin-dependent oxidoreductase (luciferase family)